MAVVAGVFPVIVVIVALLPLFAVVVLLPVLLLYTCRHILCYPFSIFRLSDNTQVITQPEYLKWPIELQLQNTIEGQH